MTDKLLNTCTIIIGEEGNSGEALELETKFLSNGDPGAAGAEGVFLNQKFTLYSYCNSASFELAGSVMCPSTLRYMADKLEAALEVAARKNKGKKAKAAKKSRKD